VVDSGDPRVHQEPFVSGPYIHRNNEPKYHAVLLRAEEFAKQERLYRIWFAALDKPCNPREVAEDPKQLNKKLERFLQFHDQRTAGIPGLCPLFVGLRMRVTEKVMKTSQITTLKHTPYYVVSWGLHPGDRVRRDEGERFLSYLPRMIIMRVENAQWQLEGLHPCEFPLFPVERTWVLSEETGVKIVRKGFALLPDFASTAFMMQGYTLDGAVADCGSVLASGGLTEMMTTHVILSCVKKTDGILLTQAFAREIFRLGVAPGPHCLLKLLHQRFSSGMSLDEA